MAQKSLTPKQIAEARALVKKHVTVLAAARAAGISEGALRNRLNRGGAILAAAAEPPRDPLTDLRTLLRAGSRGLEDLCTRLDLSQKKVEQLCAQLAGEGLNIFFGGGRVSIEKTPLPVPRQEGLHSFQSDKQGRYRFGFVTDNHLCSKYARLDVLNDLYDMFAAEGITRVYNAGNWIDGEARFNKFDLLVHGMQAQLEYFAEHYPQRPGITTFFVAGDDHEGWYAQREGVDIGRLAEHIARDRGRTDLRYMGYMEAFIELRHAKSGRSSQMMVVHPGGGSAYAISYAPQKLVESLQGGEKPAVCLIGHYHKMDVFNYRNVWICQGGTTEDQTPFMRKKKLEAHVGGMLIELRQDERGAITDCIPRMRRYFDRGYYNNQFNPAGPLGKKAA